MKLSKCHFFMKEIQYLGHILCIKGIKTLQSKMQEIKNLHLAETPKQVCAFLGVMGYYIKFIRNFAKIAKPLTLLTCHQAKFEWTPTYHNAFLTLKEFSYPSTNITLPKPKEKLQFIQIHQMMPVEHSYLKNMMEQNFQ